MSGAVDLWVLNLECCDGTSCMLTCTQSLPSTNRSLQLYGEKGNICLTEFWNFDTSVLATMDTEGSIRIPYTHPPTAKHAPHPHVCDWMRGPRILLASSADLASQACHVLDIIEAAEASAKSATYIDVASRFGSLPRLPRCIPRREGASRILLGILPFSRLTNKLEAFALLDQAWALGINMFDSGHVYGTAENTFGAWIKARQVPRDALILVGKAGHPSRGQSRLREIRKDVIESCRRLCVSYLDVVLLHRDDESMSVQEILDLLKVLKDEGLVSAWGVSNWRPQRVEELALAAEACGQKVAMNSPQVSLATPTEPVWPGTVHWDGAAADVAKRYHIPTLGWSALAEGYLVNDTLKPTWACEENAARRSRLHELSHRTGMSAAAWAVRYALNIAEHVVVGTTSPEHLVDLVRGSKVCEEAVARWLRDGGEMPAVVDGKVISRSSTSR